MELQLDQILNGDCLEHLRLIPDESIDSFVSDVPYGLGSKEPTPEDILAYLQGSSSLGPLKKGTKHCANNLVRDAAVSNAQGSDTSLPENLVTFKVTCPGPLGMPAGVINLEGQAPARQEEVDDESTVTVFHDMLMDELYASDPESSSNGVLCLRERQAFSGCVKVCCCFAQLSQTMFSVLVRLSNDSFGESQTAASVLAFGTAETSAVLTLDVARGTGELRLASSADEGDAGLLLAAAEDVGTLPGAGRLLTSLKVLLTRHVDRATNRALTFDVSVPSTLLRRLHEPRISQRDFMNKSWEVPSIAVWKEIYRVLKPGGHVLSFAGSRTADLIGIGIRMAGFESRDSIARCYPNLYWTYGSGMPKSHNIGKAIDKKLGKTREVTGVRSNHRSRPMTPNWDRSLTHKGEGYNGLGSHLEEIAEPASEQAAEWEGWGSGLKPAAEPILVFRKPLSGTLAHNVMTYGTGGLNIDATRVRHASKEDFETHKAQVDAVREKGGVRGNSWKNDSDLSGANEVKEGGRWPANLLLEHSAACRKVGTQTIAPHPQGPDRFQKTTGGDFSEAYGNQLAQDEPEVSPVWECAEGCPVRAMDDQSGDRPSTLTGRADPNGSHEHPGTEMNPNSTFLGERTHLSKVYADAGGASRFFTQIEAEAGDSSKGRWPANLVLQHAEGCVSKGPKRVKRGSGDIKGTEPSDSTNGVYGKYSKRAPNNVGENGFETIEAWECVEGCPVSTLDEQSGVLKSGKDVNPTDGPVSGFFGQEMAYYSKDANYGDEGGASRFYSQFDGVPFRYIAKANRKEAGCGEFEVQHVTVKPLELMRWLVKLVTQKGGVVLDPYCGSGSTLHAAVLEGMHYIGIERDEASYAEAKRRLDIVHARDREQRESDDVFAFAMGDGA